MLHGIPFWGPGSVGRLIKSTWTFTTEKDSLWTSVIKFKYGVYTIIDSPRNPMVMLGVGFGKVFGKAESGV